MARITARMWRESFCRLADDLGTLMVRIAELEAQRAQIERLRAALVWYEEQARLCRLLHSAGDKGRQALDADGGSRARAALDGREPRDKEEK